MENIFGKRLKEIRKVLGMTQAEVAKRLNTSQSTVAEYESGKKLPTAPVIIRIARLFNVSTDYLLGLTDDFSKHEGTPELIQQKLQELKNLKERYEKKEAKAKVPSRSLPTRNGNFPERLRWVRESKGMSQRELAKSIGISPGMISLYESAKKTPTIDVLRRIAEHFNISADYLLGLTDNPSSKAEELPEVIKKQLQEYAKLKKKYEEIKQVIKALYEKIQ